MAKRSTSRRSGRGGSTGSRRSTSSGTRSGRAQSRGGRQARGGSTSQGRRTTKRGGKSRGGAQGRGSMARQGGSKSRGSSRRSRAATSEEMTMRGTSGTRRRRRPAGEDQETQKPEEARQSAGSLRSKKSERSSEVTTDHQKIRRWAESRGGKPARVVGTGRGRGDEGVIRIMFPGAPGSRRESLKPISWDDFFEKFDQQDLALVYQERTRGARSNFSKLVSREGV